MKAERSPHLPRWLMPRPEGARPAPAEEGRTLAELVGHFRAAYPDEWDRLRLCPLQHGLDTMIERMRLR